MDCDRDGAAAAFWAAMVVTSPKNKVDPNVKTKISWQ
jgi:hypothetical protein